ncbi:trans-sulfuration enzyme family protein [Paraburkholderia caffeinilytica]|uniref:Cystathionine gamma-synthase n=1 Tax=Paraburkholderia caffeinilytica TaxID=1761016 RepID=A0ABQ1LNQ7_9BURK|nr:aminotransferase class I/II-fold pyridoxal phosphate-dependent enzyme [Paraburkholderia caffeinilytica]GGC27316.1 cystathionine gamma-synthase [Paraburkholderia caffeinilytica]CAB3780210.1 Cystathionine gamma-synthase [Paraburkholderia caffeinilytica]
MSLNASVARQTLLAQALGWVDKQSDSLGPSIHPATSFLRDPADLHRASRTYRRDDNPTFLQAEVLLATLEGGEGCLLFSSGMAAATAVMSMLSPGAHVVVSTRLYSGLRNWLFSHGRRWGIDISEADYEDVHGLRAILEARPAQIVWIETPANPLWHVSDIRAITELAHECGALVVADNTVSTPILTRPLEHGVDVVLHSGSKYLNGHADVVAGALIVGPRRAELLQRLADIRNDYGAVLGPFEAWLLLRGMRTLELRMNAICRNAFEIACFLQEHERVVEVLYPGLASHPGHVLSRKQMQGGFGGMLSFRVKGGEEVSRRLAASTKVIRQAISFGGLETVIEIRRGMEGPESRTPPDLLRLSVGTEAVKDLIADLSQALSA